MAQTKIGPISQRFYNLLKPCHDLETKHSKQEPMETVHIHTINEGGVWSVVLEASGETALRFSHRRCNE